MSADEDITWNAPAAEDVTWHEPSMFLGPEDASGKRHAVPQTQFNEPPKERGIVQRAKEGAMSAYEEPLGFSPENQKRFPALGQVQQHVPAITLADAAIRAPGAIWGGLSGAAAGVGEKVMGPAWADRMQRDLHALPQAAAGEFGVSPKMLPARPAEIVKREARPPPLPVEAFPDTPRQVARPDVGVGLLPIETPHALPPERSGLSAAGVGGPLSNTSPETIAHMKKVMAEQGYNEHTIDQRLSEMSAHHFFGEINPSLEGDMGAVAATSRPAQVEVQGSMRQRAIEAPERVQHVFNRAFGEAENLPQAKRLMEVERSREADPLYKQFRETTITPTPEIEALLPRLEAAGVLQGANRALRIEGEPTTRGFQIPGDPPTMQNVPTASAFQIALEQISDKVGNAIREGNMNEARRMTALRRDLTGALDTHPNVGETWKQARQAYATPAAIEDATKMGQDVLTNRVSADELPFLTAAYTPQEMRALRIGMRDHLEQMLGKREALTAEVLNTVLSPNNVRKIRWAIGDQAADALVSEIRHEAHMHGASTRVYGGSPSGFRLAAQKRWSVEPGALDNVGLSDVAHAAAHPVKTVVGKVAEEVGLSHRRKQEAAMARLREEASHLFTLQGPERDAVARYLVGGPGAQPYKRGGSVRRNADGDKRAPLVRKAMQKPRKAGGGELMSDDEAAMMPETFANPFVDRALRGAGEFAAAPGHLIKPNPYKPDSEEAYWYEDQRAKGMLNWSREAAMNTMGTGAIAGVPARGGEMVLGSGVARKTSPLPEHQVTSARINPDVVPTTRASAEEINRAAVESEGMTQPQLRQTYRELGLTGGAPSDLARPALREQPMEEIERAIRLKLDDREAMQALTPEERRAFQLGKLKKPGFKLPSTELNEAAAVNYPTKDIAKAQKQFEKDAASSNTGRPPSLFDLSPETLNRVPDLDQFALPRAAPKITDRLKSAFEGGAGLKRLEQAAGKAPAENWGWYNLQQAHSDFVRAHGPVKGEEAWNAWLDQIAGTSMVNPIDNNIRSASHYLARTLRGEPLPEVLQIKDPFSGKSVQTLAGGPPPGYGGKSQVQHAARVRQFMTRDLDPVANAKPFSFRQNLGGNWVPRTVDTHDIRNAIGMPRAKSLFNEENSALLPGEYSALEKLGARAAERAGSTNAAQQAATWIGGGEYTGLKSNPVPFMEALNRRIQVTAKVRGQSPEQVWQDMITGKDQLFARGGQVASRRAAYADGGTPEGDIGPRNPFDGAPAKPNPFDWSGVGEAMPEHIGRDRILDPIINTAMLPKRALDASAADVAHYQEHGFGGTDYTPQTVGPAAETALGLMGGASPFAEVGAAGVFGGRLAKTADHAALARAESMFQKGHGPDAIWEQTGWYRGPEGAWRFEIPDTAATLKAGDGQLSDVLHHPDLYKAYPDLAGVQAEVGAPSPAPGMRAQYQVKDPNPIFPEKFEVFGGTHDPRSSMLHEVQHAIQERENFARGSSPAASNVRDIAHAEIQNERAAAQARFEELSAARDQWLGDYAKRHNIDLTTGEGYQQANRAHNDANRASEVERNNLFNTYTAWGGPSRQRKIDTYRKFAGEVEARNVQERLGLGEEGQAVPPHWTQDTPTSQQFVSMKNPTAFRRGGETRKRA